jgi:hypothetical protein
MTSRSVLPQPLRDVIDSPRNRSTEDHQARDLLLTSNAQKSESTQKLCSQHARESFFHQSAEDASRALSNGDEQLSQRERTIHGLTEENRILRKRLADAEHDMEKLKSASKLNEQMILSRLKDETAELAAQTEELSRDRALTKDQLRSMTLRCDQLAEEARQRTKDADEARSRCKGLEDVVRRLQVDADQRSERIRGDNCDLQEAKIRYDVQLRAMQAKFDSLDGQCASLRRERDALDQQARQAQLELHEVRAKRDNRVLVDVRELQLKEQECLRLDEEVVAAHMTNIRLLRIMSESAELRNIIAFNDISKEFVFVGYQLDEAEKHTSDVRRRNRKAETGGDFGIVSGNSRPSKNVLLSDGAAAGALRQLHDAITDENAFIRRRHVDVSATGTDQLMNLKTEMDFWIPHGAFVEGQKFRAEFMPSVPASIFYPLFVRLNKLWRERMTSRINAAKTDAAVRRHSQGDRDRLMIKERDGGSAVDEAATRELMLLRREVRAKVSSKAALHLFACYDQLAREALRRRAELESQFSNLASVHNQTLSSKAPEAINMQFHLRTIAETSQSLAAHVSQKLVGASSDIRRFLTSLEDATTQGPNATSSVSTTVLRQVVACSKDFAEEVRQEAQVTSDSLKRLSEVAERAANAAVPFAPPPEGAGGAKKLHHQGRGFSAASTRFGAFDDLVDDDDMN